MKDFTNEYISIAKKVISAEEETSKTLFQMYKKSKVIEGEWESESWRYKSTNALFRPSVVSKDRSPYSGLLETIVKCYVINMIGRDVSASDLRGQVIASRIVIDDIGDLCEKWVQLKRSDADRIVKRLHTLYQTESTIYKRACDVRSFLKYVADIRHSFDGASHTFLARPFKWTPGMVNPIRKTLDVTTEEFKHHSERKLPKEVEKAIGLIRRKLIDHPEIEPKSGLINIRMQFVAFLLSMGLRVGEVTTLNRHALRFDDRSEALRIDIWTEKSNHPRQSPVPDIWAPVLKEAENYLVDECRAARARAKEIEANGFSFICKDLLSYRNQHPLCKNILSTMEVMRLNIEHTFLVEEIISVYDVSRKSFDVDGRFFSHAISPLRLSAVRLISWIDERFKRWDWDEWLFELKYKSKCETFRKFGLTHSSIAINSGMLKGNAFNISWVSAFIKAFIHVLDTHGVFTNELPRVKPISKRDKSALIRFWTEQKYQLMMQRGGQTGIFVDVNSFTKHLQEQYFQVMEAHYQKPINCFKDLTCTSISSSYDHPQPLSDHLFVVWEHQFDTVSPHFGILPTPVSRTDIYNFFYKNSQNISVFELLDIRDENNDFYKFTPHQFRHWVTDALLRAGPNEMLVDLYMGRSPGHTRHYDHRTGVERAEKVRSQQTYLQSVPPDDWLGRRILKMREANIPLAEISEYIERKLQILHFTPWGYCSRDLTHLPCARGMSCLRGLHNDGCEHFHIDVNDEAAKLEIEKLLNLNQLQLDALLPNREWLDTAFQKEMNDVSQLDQHTRYLVQNINGCQRALKAYSKSEVAVLNEPAQIWTVPVFGGRD